MFNNKKNTYKKGNSTYKGALIALVGATLLGGSIYIGKQITDPVTEEKKEPCMVEKKISEKDPAFQEKMNLDDVIKPEEKKEPVEPTTKEDKLDYSAIKDLDPVLQERVKSTLEEDILSERWISHRYARMFSQLSKFDDMLVDSRNYALLVQEIGPYLLNNSRLPKSRAGASGYGQLMAVSKIENNLVSDGIIDESYHPIKGIEAAMQHHKRYNFENILPELNKNLSLDTAVYNFGYGNVMNSLAQIIEEKGKDPHEIFRYSAYNTIAGIKNYKKLDSLDISYEKFSEKIPQETRNYIEKVNALTVFKNNASVGNIDGIEIEKKPLFSGLFEERRLGEGNYLYRVWENEVKDKGISWQIYSDVVNMHIQNNTNLKPDTKILVPVKEIPADYF